MNKHTFTIEELTPRLDTFLAQQESLSASRSQVAKWIKKGCVTVNALPTRAAAELNPGDVIQLEIPLEAEPSKLIPEKMDLDILYEDKDLLVLNKSPNLVVHPGAGHWQGTLTHALLAHCGKLSSIGGVERPGIVHRLDKGTSGAMVVAKNDKTHTELSRQFKDHEVTKTYWALVYGVPKEEKGTIHTLLSRSRQDRHKFSVSRSSGKDSVTHYQTLKQGKGLSLLEVSLETGRTHQIRVHLTDKGHSLVGDLLYGGHTRRVRTVENGVLRKLLRELDHTLLHSRTLGFVHPAKKEKMSWTAELPQDFKDIMTTAFGE